MTLSHDHCRTLGAAHDHLFLGENHARNERRTWLVIAITASMMVIEIVAGNMFGSMALVADGWHMSTHAAAMLIAALAYLYARRHANNRRFSFGTGKLGDLAGFASAVVLALIALMIAWESFLRLRSPVSINFQEAIFVAVVGLLVNIVCAWLLRDDHHHAHGHHHAHDHGAHHDDHHGHGGKDQNLRAAYVHVLADALTSVLAIGALVLGSIYGWLWLDPAIGIVGGIVIARWSWVLVRDSGRVLLDYQSDDEDLPEEIKDIMTREGVEILDLHVWQLGPGHHGAIVSIVADHPHAPSYYREKLAAIHDLSHVTVEVEARAA
ncbi:MULTISPECIES: CDF family Co(II)/Ni(II) efflux transporter DmeF [unclassified Rhizobium]|uniref:CDF family Co(II)/Ni(II) efflux transporter DmeF n=1 Tax=unclassified Rhizobium TaxID=2613769 RepID=UPI0011601FD6|nr:MULTISPECIES: CDF family Co(II)/Ni(II) efflux transporter DmeF [unclassified Rhizobium]MBZ5763004.1 CDF family Co(II)/Ni(II) efflux transporter DmeF [Rhizobium sp. VS19-DR96]MBZ5768876.1 CDF family Co(II)/Ni(II) efflux transporter DmeF [Rhizobium sp. VS19-DR129.2]MBZ5776504.1 CDF family Co(II)/Ni(II) efflux transporter DmeF [Rhizobium sp. VS19-DRK62.2]MBZ5787660.1 CDF family Co(II)/Ni(II) efflux transporter DmeF [Rhizobium sp. VS19-DR121]MBZ5805167.1 CDF family Co(II)/Ni(II) efflux transpor